uniref:BRCT domain-containing protein n=1 Tax=Podarcis muralis TaxID=64176 RepID=A0A670IYQ3_PODMU
AGRKWVVSYHCKCEHSLKYLYSLPSHSCKDFEVRGDMINGRNHQGPKRARESPVGKWMVELSGASIVKEPRLFSHSTVSVGLILWVQRNGATVVSREWMLDSIACYQRQAFDEYIVQQV